MTTEIDWIQFTMATATAGGLLWEAIRWRKEVKEGKKATNETKQQLETHRKEVETLTKQLELDAYQEVRIDHNKLIRLLVSVPYLNKCWNTVPETPKKKKLDELTDEEKSLFGFYLAWFDLYERVHELYKEQKIDDEEWQSWLRWLKPMSNNWLFEFAYNHLVGIYYSEFLEWIKKEIINPRTQNV